ncbi:hypothetical protein SAMN05216382_0960 [Sphingomonas palmae]|uniref:Uncharacterized protein n=1 Tax=Sphingomonas palmae TaxID=1855283 RepID=A0A1H7J8R4_9SPHN|nr:hypothetical protein [Sphingomonas palmae]SEK70744.1 hypothetical protein SAMN05216382_0960 [Sphingomonas palmae]
MSVSAAPAPRTAPRLAMWLVFAAILVAPLIAMRFTDQVNWTAFDFAAAAALLALLGLSVEAATRLLHRPLARRAAVAAAVVLVALIWAEGAVGIFH